MRRADRLLLIVQALRRRRGPVTAQVLAEEIEVSRRTIYRDILDLQAARVPIEGEAGVGYVLRPGYDLPPLMFTVEEVEAIVLGARLAQDRGDPGLARAAQDVLAKVAAVLPEPLAASLERSALLVPHRSTEELSFGPHLPELRHAVREHGKLCLDYVTERGDTTERVIWPLALFYYSHAALVGAWCELRTDYRLFRADRILSLGRTGQRFNARNGSLLQEFLHRTGHAPGNAAFDVQRNDPEN